MKKTALFLTVLLGLSGVIAYTETPTSFDWSLMTSGMWEDGKTLHNRMDLRLNFSPADLTLRGQILDRRPFIFDDLPNSPWGDSAKIVTHYQTGLYHNKTGSRLLYGALDEWGLSARIRNPWIRSPPYAENHKPLMADLKTSVSSTKEDELYLYLSTPFLDLSQDIGMRGFVSAQTEIPGVSSVISPAFSGGIEFSLPNKSNLLVETFYTWATLPPVNRSTWFSYPPPLPERDFRFYAAGFLFSNTWLSVSSDFAASDTFAWGLGIYANLGVSVSMPIPAFIPWNAGRNTKPLTFSLAFDGAGERFVYRDGLDHGEASRTAAKVELKGFRNALMRLSTTLRSPNAFLVNGNFTNSADFNRSSTNFYFRLPATGKDSGIFQLTRISISIDRNADNLQKIIDRLYGYIGFSLNLSKFNIKTPIGIYLNGSVRGITSSEGNVSPYPGFNESWDFQDCSFYGELTFSPLNYQFRTRIGYSNNAKNNQIWDFSASGAVRFKKGRFSLKLNSANFPNLWDFTISWRLEAG